MSMINKDCYYYYYPVHGGPGRPRHGTWRQFSRVCRRHAAICPLSSRRSDVRT